MRVQRLGSAGSGAPSRDVVVTGFVTTVSSDLTGSTYQLVRVPSFAIIKRVQIAWAAMGAGDLDLSVYYSSSKVDGTAAANQGLVVPTTGATFFASQINCASAVSQTDETFQNQATSGANNPSLINKRLWDALGLASDPGGFFDIVAVVDTTAITTGGGKISLNVEYAE